MTIATNLGLPQPIPNKSNMLKFENGITCFHTLFHGRMSLLITNKLYTHLEIETNNKL